MMIKQEDIKFDGVFQNNDATSYPPVASIERQGRVLVPHGEKEYLVKWIAFDLHGRTYYSGTISTGIGHDQPISDKVYYEFQVDIGVAGDNQFSFEGITLKGLQAKSLESMDAILMAKAMLGIERGLVVKEFYTTLDYRWIVARKGDVQ